jgi:hypothetical protein
MNPLILCIPKDCERKYKHKFLKVKPLNLIMSEVAMSMKEVIFEAYILPLTLYKYVIRRDLWLEYSSA